MTIRKAVRALATAFAAAAALAAVLGFAHAVQPDPGGITGGLAQPAAVHQPDPSWVGG